MTTDEQMNWSQFQSVLTNRLSLFWLVILLFQYWKPFLEILKWQNLSSLIRPITISESTKQVLAALTVGLFTPNGIGEYAGKAMYYRKQHATKIVF